MTDPVFFASAEEFRQWLDAHYATTAELRLGFFKKHSGHVGITYAEALDEALSFGWIDGVRQGIDAARYAIRFSPRKPGSVWSAVNIQRAELLAEQGRMQPAELEAFRDRDPARSRQYSYEGDAGQLGDAEMQRFRANEAAWAFFQAQPPSYRRAAIWWVVGATQDATRARRLTTLIEDSANGLRAAHLRPRRTARDMRPAIAKENGDAS